MGEMQSMEFAGSHAFRPGTADSRRCDFPDCGARGESPNHNGWTPREVTFPARVPFEETGGVVCRPCYDRSVTACGHSPAAAAKPRPIATVTTLPTHGQTTIHVVPPRACGLGDCVGELHVQISHDSIRLHINDDQRNALIVALGGVLPALHKISTGRFALQRVYDLAYNDAPDLPSIVKQVADELGVTLDTP